MILNAKNVSLILAGIVAMVSLAGCSAPTKTVNEQGVTIERVNSTQAEITRVNLYTINSKHNVLRGEFKRRTNLRGKIPGHLHVELADLNGKVFKKAKLDYRQKNSKSQIALFSVSLPVDLAQISKVRIIHHTPGLDSTNSTASIWRDVDQSK